MKIAVEKELLELFKDNFPGAEVYDAKFYDGDIDILIQKSSKSYTVTLSPSQNVLQLVKYLAPLYLQEYVCD